MALIASGPYTEPRLKPAKHEVLAIANQYLEGADRAEVVNQLSSKGSLGSLLAAEIVIDYAIDDKPSMASTWLTVADGLLKDCQKKPEKEDPLNPGLIPTPHARAAMRLPQLSLIQCLIRNQRLPSESSVSRSYSQLVGVGHRIATNYRYETKINNDHAKEIGGLLGEIAVLGLAMRFSLTSGIGSDTWLPLQSRFRDDHGGSCKPGSGQDKKNPCFDMDIFTASEGRSPEKTYAIQIKGYDFGQGNDSPVLFIDPNLRINSAERHIPTLIINELNYELDPRIRYTTRITDNLDKRTGRLLDRIDEIS